MTNAIALSTYYIITGISNTKGENAGKRVFLAVDHASGSYSYWSGNEFHAERYSDIEKALRELQCTLNGYANDQATAIALVKVVPVAEVVTKSDVQNILDAKAQKEIGAIQKNVSEIKAKFDGFY